MVRARARAAGGTHGEVLGWVSLEAELRQGVKSKDCIWGSPRKSSSMGGK